MTTFNSIGSGSGSFSSRIARSSDSSSRFSSGPKAPSKIGAIGDAHGSRSWIDWIEVLAPQVDKIVFTGDLLDRGVNNLDVFEKAKELHAKGTLIPLWGNHDLMFIMAMAEDPTAYARWMLNGGKSVLQEVGIDPSDPPAVFNRVTENAKLKEISQWMANCFKLYNIDEYNTLYMHAGIPLDYNGTVTLNYGGKQGLMALKLADEEMKISLQNGNINHPVFGFLQGNRQALLWNRDWIEIAKEVGADEVLGQLGIEMLVFGHTFQERTLNIGNRIFGIDRGMVSDEGAIWMRDVNEVAVDSVCGGKRQELIPQSPIMPHQENPVDPNDSLDDSDPLPIPLYGSKSINYNKPITIVLSPGMNPPVLIRIVDKNIDRDNALIKDHFGFDYYALIITDCQTQTFPIPNDNEIIIGRSSKVFGWEILPGHISRQHVKISRHENTFTITDLDSSNGTAIYP